MSTLLEKAIGGLSTPSKMPGYSYGIPAKECKLGSLLRKTAGSVCHKCYALKGMYVFPCVQKAQYKRLAIIQSDIQSWANAMAKVIAWKYRRKLTIADRVFRWHDSGDLQSIEHLSAIVEIARVLPDIRFWLPTREAGMVKEYLRDSPAGFPSNLTVRISATMVGQRVAMTIPGVVYSTVGLKAGHQCPARTQDNNCGDCRACWSSEIKSVDYPLH